MNGGDATRGGGGGNTKERRSGSISELESPKNQNPAGPQRRGSNNNGNTNGNGNGNTNGNGNNKNATPTAASASNSSKVTAQMQKMRDANNKYKNLLKMAKERIEQQEIELKDMRENERKRAEEETASKETGGDNNSNANYLDDANDDLNNNSWILTRVSQRIRVDLETNEEIWALCEWDRDESDEQQFLINNNNNKNPANNKRKQWKRFDSESDLTDFIRRDTGEPLTLPPYSLTQQQSSRMVSEAEKKVSAITEEYRRFRVKSGMSRKQMDAQIRDLQSSQVESAKRQIEGVGRHVEQELEANRRTENGTELKRMRAEAARQEDQWKEAYDILLKENEALKMPGSDALLASQWRQRYEACAKERDEAVNKLQSAQQRHEQHKQQQQSASFSSPPNVRNKSTSGSGEGKYEMKYRDLKESFRLYRKKAKEIFESQNTNTGGGADNRKSSSSNRSGRVVLQQMSQHNFNNADEDSKLSYLKNLMVNYLTADPEVRDHMESAIGTVLKFTQNDIAAIEKKKTDASWSAYIGYT